MGAMLFPCQHRGQGCHAAQEDYFNLGTSFDEIFLTRFWGSKQARKASAKKDYIAEDLQSITHEFAAEFLFLCRLICVRWLLLLLLLPVSPLSANSSSSFSFHSGPTVRERERKRKRERERELYLSTAAKGKKPGAQTCRQGRERERVNVCVREKEEKFACD
jgi:hypothetical protein